MLALRRSHTAQEPVLLCAFMGRGRLMAWLRVDDGFTEHRKLLGLKRSDRWTWMEVLTYCARQNNGGHVPSQITGMLRFVTPKFLKSCVSVGLLDELPDGQLRVHDWEHYNPKDPSHAARQARYRGRKRDGNRDAESDALGDAESDAPRAAARARPVPSPSPEHRTLSEGSSHPDPEREIHDSDNDRWQAWQTYAETAPGIRSPAAYARSGYDTGDWPPEDQPDISKVTVKYEHECPGCGLGLKTAVALADHIHVIHPELERATA